METEVLAAHDEVQCVCYAPEAAAKTGTKTHNSSRGVLLVPKTRHFTCNVIPGCLLYF